MNIKQFLVRQTFVSFIIKSNSNIALEFYKEDYPKLYNKIIRQIRSKFEENIYNITIEDIQLYAYNSLENRVIFNPYVHYKYQNGGGVAYFEGEKF